MGHSGPLHPKDDVVGVELGLVAAYLRHDVVGGAEQEAVARQIFVWHAEALFARQRLVLPPSGVGGVLALQVWAAFGKRRRAVFGYIHFAKHRHSGWHRLAGAFQFGAIHRRLARYRRHSRVRVDQPRVAPARGAADGYVVVGGNPYGRVRLLYRARYRRCFGNGVVFAAKLHFIVEPQSTDHIQRFAQPPYSLAALDAECLELFVAIAKPNAEYEPAVADSVHSGDGFSQVDGIVQRHKYDGGSDFHIARFGGHARQKRQCGGLLIRRRQEVLPCAYQVKARLARRPHLFGAVRYLLRQ